MFGHPFVVAMPPGSASGINHLAVLLLVIYMHALVLTLVEVEGTGHSPRANLPNRNELALYPLDFVVAAPRGNRYAGYPIGTALYPLDLVIALRSGSPI